MNLSRLFKKQIQNITGELRQVDRVGGPELTTLTNTPKLQLFTEQLLMKKTRKDLQLKI